MSKHVELPLRRSDQITRFDYIAFFWKYFINKSSSITSFWKLLYVYRKLKNIDFQYKLSKYLRTKVNLLFKFVFWTKIAVFNLEKSFFKFQFFAKL